MGGGGLRILGHKKWHVWRRDNIERVLRDEREHDEQQRATRDRQRRREQDQRAEALAHAADADGLRSAAESAAPRHINFFEAEEQAHTLALLKGADGRNAQRTQRDTLGRQAQLPWYATASTEPSDDQSSALRCDRRKRTRALETQDPLAWMRPPRGAKDTEADEDEDERVRLRVRSATKRRRRRNSNDADSERGGGSDGPRRRKAEKKQKKQKKQLHRADGDGDSELMVRLRQEREDREAAERARAERLMCDH